MNNGWWSLSCFSGLGRAGALYCRWNDRVSSGQRSCLVCSDMLELVRAIGDADWVSRSLTAGRRTPGRCIVVVRGVHAASFVRKRGRCGIGIAMVVGRLF